MEDKAECVEAVADAHGIARAGEGGEALFEGATFGTSDVASAADDAAHSLLDVAEIGGVDSGEV